MPDPTGGTVLAVTEDLIFRSKIRTSLERAGYAVRFAGASGLPGAVRESTPSLLLVDYSLCGEAGFEAVAALKQDPATRSIPILAYGPHLDLAARERARAAGADAVLANSQVASDLPGVVGDWLARGKRGAPESMMTGPAPGSARLRLGHSPDPDDAFMFYPLACGKIDTEGLEFEQVLRDIETLNRMALEGTIEITAASVHAYAHLSERYAILTCGGSFGDGYGPLLVSRAPLAPGDLSGKLIAVPGTLTSAYLALRLYAGAFTHRVVPFDRIPELVLEGSVDAGLLIHEGQLTYARSGLFPVVDLGVWWGRETGLPLPLGVNLVRKDLGEARCRQVGRLLRLAVEFSLAHREEALTYAMGFGRGLARDLTDRFVGMYVNDLTRDAGSRGRRAIAEFLDRGHAAGILPRRVTPEFVEA